jgi:hypothetical protein
MVLGHACGENRSGGVLDKSYGVTPSILVLEDIFDCDTVFKTQL